MYILPEIVVKGVRGSSTSRDIEIATIIILYIIYYIYEDRYEGGTDRV